MGLVYFVNNDTIQPASGDIVRSSGQNWGAVLAQADSVAHSTAILGVWIDVPRPGSSGNIQTDGPMEVNCLEAVVPGDSLYLSATVAGKAVKTPPEYAVFLGTVYNVRFISNVYRATIEFADAANLQSVLANASSILPLATTENTGIVPHWPPTKTDVGLNNVTNDSQVKRSEMDVASGVAVLDINRLIASARMPTALQGLVDSPTFAPISGAEAFNGASVAYGINQTGGASGTVTGVLVNAIETAVLGTHNLLDLQVSSVSRFKVDRYGNATIVQAVENALVPTALTVIGGAHTAITAGTEAVGVNFNFSATKTWVTGAIATQREVLFQAPTYAFVAPSTVTTAASVAITGPPVAGANATISRPLAFWVQTGKSSFGDSVGVGTTLPGAVLHLVTAAAASTFPGMQIAAGFTTVDQQNLAIMLSGFNQSGQYNTICSGSNATNDINGCIAFHNVSGWAQDLDFFVNRAGAARSLAQVIAAGPLVRFASTGVLENRGGLLLHGTDVNAVGPYEVLSTDCFLEVRYTITAAIQINLPSIATAGNGRIIAIIDSGYNAAVNNITVARNGSDKINNVADNYTISSVGNCVWFKSNATTNNWEIV